MYYLIVVFALGLAFGGEAFAQSPSPEPTTREEALRAAREQKQKRTTANQPDALQRGLDFVEDRALHILTREGFYPKIGSLTTGSGFAVGVGFRDRSVFRRHGVAEVWAAGSRNRYWAMQARAAFPAQPRRPYLAELVADLREYPTESFFGLGPESRRNNETRFSLRTRDLYGRAGIRVLPAVMIGGNAGWYVPRTAVGEINYTRSGVFFEVDYREPKNARQGGWYRVDLNQHVDKDGGRYSFRRVDVDLRQYIGFLSERRVVALRGLLSTTDPLGDDSRGVPFWLMPSLGGNDSLRGFRDYRFRGPHAMLLQAEYRWEIWSGLDAALFYDAGKVAMWRSALSLKDLERDYGFGFRFNTAEGVVMRVDAAFGSRDGKHLQIVFGGVF